MGTYAKYSGEGGSGGEGIASINGDTTQAQIITGGTDITVSTSSGTTMVSFNAASSFANAHLSNLVSPTAINQNLLFASSVEIGAPASTSSPANVYVVSGGSFGWDTNNYINYNGGNGFTSFYTDGELWFQTNSANFNANVLYNLIVGGSGTFGGTPPSVTLGQVTAQPTPAVSTAYGTVFKACGTFPSNVNEYGLGFYSILTSAHTAAFYANFYGDALTVSSGTVTNFTNYYATGNTTATYNSILTDTYNTTANYGIYLASTNPNFFGGAMYVASLGVGDTSAASVGGTGVVGKMPVYNQTGTLIGYAVLYSSVT